MVKLQVPGIVEAFSNLSFRKILVSFNSSVLPNDALHVREETYREGAINSQKNSNW